MKTAISVPDSTFERVSKCAARLGISRSEFFASAAERYLEQVEAATVTEQINRALAATGTDDSNELAALAGTSRLEASDDEW
ncbi:ribbon-helix-helix protein, CopG family [Actinobacteria bacterium YIM 96077]|uniref:Antitoxin n=1 Tax=Phytoactinopolyspora halophila TaxID=1981511 RepID=A0A329QSX4_9ACTN|nr:ribbon-helix-helix protein, CopG family [Phytoactinopolyspora halophila]AYY14958.1 ribbon-helix-helix protein, CopG family [Actinobacteria bacterium YIM 96077]RAW15415.1 antitoxin [Phytoactinopolyspora halophila]